jgi:uncharacterized SAM-binding protein YcdF (DUF218 family)
MKSLRSLLKKEQTEEMGSPQGLSGWTDLQPPAFETEPGAGEEKGQDGFVFDNQPIEPDSGKKGRPGFLKWIFFIILIGYTFLSYSHVPILTWVGSLLVLEHPVKRADLIVCTPGNPFETGLMAADLYKKGMAKRIFIPEISSPTALRLVNKQGGHYPTPGELLLSIMKTLEVPVSACIIGKKPLRSIWEEAEEVRRQVLDAGKSTIILVSPPWKSRRTWSIFETVFQDDQVEIMMAPSTYTDFKIDNWWKNDKSFYEAILEFQKLLGLKVRQIL